MDSLGPFACRQLKALVRDAAEPQRRVRAEYLASAKISQPVCDGSIRMGDTFHRLHHCPHLLFMQPIVRPRARAPASNPTILLLNLILHADLQPDTAPLFVLHAVHSDGAAGIPRFIVCVPTGGGA
jgi:hypothetical protein